MSRVRAPSPAPLPSFPRDDSLCPCRRVASTYLSDLACELQRPTAIEADVCKPLPVDGPFDSAALTGVPHCLPGPLPRKAAAFANVAAVLAPTGVLFGASILGPSGRHTWLSRSILEANNR